MVPTSTHPVGVFIVAAVLSEWSFCPLSQEDLGADVTVTYGPSPQHRSQRHVTERWGWQNADRRDWWLSSFYFIYFQIKFLFTRSILKYFVLHGRYLYTASFFMSVKKTEGDKR